MMIYTHLTKKALKIAFEAHKDQLDKSGLPYVFHPFHLAEQMDDEYSVCVALLHDVAEDTDMTVDDLAAEGFPREVIDALSLLTHERGVPYMDYIREIRKNPLAARVKLADLEHNSDSSRLEVLDDTALAREEKYRQAMLLLRSGERAERKPDVIPALETACCHVKVPADCRYCVSCGKPVVSAKETEMEFHTDDTLTLCRRCMGDMRISDRYCGRCGERSSLWKEDKENERLRDRVRGSLLGGAAGDALGYAVEFQGEKQIFSEYGTEGIREYELSGAGRKAMISDDTQMTLFTAEAITKWLASRAEGGTERSLGAFALDAYLDWLDTQESSFERAGRPAETDSLMAERGMFSRRAPGFTCLSALEKRRQRGGAAGSFIAGKLNNSKGCGGVMRVAPVGMLKYGGTDRIDREGAELAAITHGNSLGYIPAALLTHIIHGILYSGTERTLRDTVTEALGSVAALFRDDPQIGDFVRLINYAVTLSENCERDLDNIHRLGEGWIGEEALAVAVYCCLRHTYDFSRCIITAVNHKGDSDSTGAIAGNILGAYLGYEAIEEKWKENLELSDVILGVADRLYGELVSEPVPASL